MCLLRAKPLTFTLLKRAPLHILILRQSSFFLGKLRSFTMVITSEFKILLDLYFLIHSNKHRLEKQDVFELKDLLKPVAAMTTGVNGSTQQRLTLIKVCLL